MFQSLLNLDKQISSCDNIMQGGREEARSAAFGEDYQVLKALSAGSLMVVLCESSLVCFGACTAVLGLRCFPQHASDWLETGHDTGHDTAGRLSACSPCDHTAHCTRTTPATPPGLTTAWLLRTRVNTLHHPRPGQEKPQGAVNESLQPYWPDTPQLQADAVFHRVMSTHGFSLTSLYR